MTETKLVIFDLDGTLVNAFRAVCESLNYALGKKGYALLDQDLVTRSVGWGERHLVSKFVDEKDLEETLSLYREHHQVALLKGVDFLPSARQTLDALKQKGITLAIASNRPSFFTNIILKSLNVLEHFEMVVCADHVDQGKPHPDMILKILQDLKCDQNEAIFVGDMHIDIEAGTRAGVRSAIVLTGSCTEEDIKGLNPSYIIHNVGEILEKV